MSVAGPSTTIIPRITFGVELKEKNVWFIESQTLLHSGGPGLIIHDLQTKRQKFIQLPSYSKLELSTNRQFLAVVENGARPVVSLYNAKTSKLYKRLGNPFREYTTNEVLSVKFSCNNKWLFVLLGKPDFILLVYNWKKGKVVSRNEMRDIGCESVVEIEPNTFDTNSIALIGPGKVYTMCYTNVWRLLESFDAEFVPFCCACWLTRDQVLVGSKDGRLVIIEFGQLRGIFKAHRNQKIVILPKDERSCCKSFNLATNKLSKQEREGKYSVRFLTHLNRGFMYSCMAGVLVLFEKKDMRTYALKNVYRVSESYSSKVESGNMNAIHHVTFSPQQDRVIVSTVKCSLYVGQLFVEQNFEETQFILLTEVETPGHFGPVGTITTCSWKAYFLTYGSTDDTIRLWDYRTCSVLFKKSFNETIYSIDLHPTGFYCAIGFIEKVTFNLMVERNFKELCQVKLRGCHLLKFSNNGHLLAAVHGSVIEVYSTLSFEQCHVYKSHLSNIFAVAWGPHDNILASTGGEGSLYVWNTISGQRILDIYLPQAHLYGLYFMKKISRLFAVGSDGEIKEILGAKVKSKLNLGMGQLTSICMAEKTKYIFLGTDTGYIVAFQYPLSPPPAIEKFKLHPKGVSHLALIKHDSILVSASTDGSLCLWDVNEKCVRTRQTLKDGVVADEIISIESLERTRSELSELQSRIKKAEFEHEYILQRTLTKHNATLEELHEGYMSTIEDLNARIKNVDREHLLNMNNCLTKFETSVTKHLGELSQVDQKYSLKLLVEHEKFAQLENEFADMVKANDKHVRLLQEEAQQNLEESVAEKDKTIESLQKRIEILQKMLELQKKRSESIIEQFQDDCDREICEVRGILGKRVDEEKETSSYLKNQNQALRDKTTEYSLLIDAFKLQIFSLKESERVLKKTIRDQNEEIAIINDQLKSKEEVIIEKERAVLHVTRKNVGFFKQKYVRDTIIASLRDRIEPKNVELYLKSKLITNLEHEVANFKRKLSKKKLEIFSLKRRLMVSNGEMKKQKFITDNVTRVLRKLHMDLYAAAAVIYEPKRLQPLILKMFHTYVNHDELAEVRADISLASEFYRQRRHMEVAVRSLRKRMSESKSNKHTVEGLLLRNRKLAAEIKQLEGLLNMQQKKTSDEELNEAQELDDGGTSAASTGDSPKKPKSVTTTDPNDPEKIVKSEKLFEMCDDDSVFADLDQN